MPKLNVCIKDGKHDAGMPWRQCEIELRQPRNQGGALATRVPVFPLVNTRPAGSLCGPFMKADIHPKYVDSEIRCACGNVIKTRSTRPVVIVGICNACHPFYTGQQKFVDTAGRVDKFQQRLAKTKAAQEAAAATKKKKK
jgi:large subunit ribosomal protein L31